MRDMPEIAAMPVVHVEDEHAAALEVLAGSGLVPPLRLVPRSRRASPCARNPPARPCVGRVRLIGASVNQAR